MSSKKYKNSPISEAVCEIAFNSSSVPTEEMLLLVKQNLQSDFPVLKKVVQGTSEVIFSPENPKIENKDIEYLDQLFTKDEKGLVQLNKNKISIHRLNSYDGWDNFFDSIKKVGSAYLANTKQDSVRRIGIRYINRIEIPGNSFKIEDYFNLYPKIVGSNIEHPIASFMIGTEFVYNEGRDICRVILTTDPGVKSSNTIFILDIDYSSTEVECNTDKIFDWFSAGHENISDLFESILTSKTKELID